VTNLISREPKRTPVRERPPLDCALDRAANGLADSILDEFDACYPAAPVTSVPAARPSRFVRITALVATALLPFLASCAPQARPDDGATARISEDIAAARALGGPSSMAPGKRVSGSAFWEGYPWVGD